MQPKNQNLKTPQNILPADGIAYYFGKIVPQADTEAYYQTLLKNICWKNDEVTVFGKRHIMKRQAAWYGDRPFEYTYSNTKKTALPWTAELLELKEIAERVSNENYNSCLLNLYHDGSESMGWHSDDEETIAINSAIASMSFGAERKFALKHKTTKETISIILENGSLLVMMGETQSNWVHSVPKSTKVTEPRINLTFRKFEQ